MVALLIYRAAEFSPNNIQKDAAILEAVGQQLQGQGWTVQYRHEEELLASDVAFAQGIWSMARRLSSLQLLAQAPCKVCNPVAATRLCVSSRTAIVGLLQKAQVMVPPPGVPGWVKGMHERGVVQGDVTYVATQHEAQTRMAQLQQAGYTDVMLSRHQPGALLKAYGVCGAQGAPLWLRWFWPMSEAYTKFGDEAAVSQPSELPFHEPQLQALAATIAHTLGLQVFGFDVMVDASGNLWVIDVNDWPSFSRYRDEAAVAIAQLPL